MRNGFKKFLFVTYLFVVTLIVLEFGVRLWGYSGHHFYDPIYMPFEGTQEIPYVHKPNLSNARARGHSVINTDSLGLRSKGSGTSYGSKKHDEYRIAIVGDSGTFGEGVAKTVDTYPLVRETLRNIHLSYVINDLSRLGFPTGNDVMQKLRKGELPESYLYIRRFKEVAEAHHRSHVIVFRPSSWPPFWQTVAEQLHRDRISFIDLSWLRNEFSRDQFRASRFDPHPSAAVHHRMGEALAEYVQMGPMKARLLRGPG